MNGAVIETLFRQHMLGEAKLARHIKVQVQGVLAGFSQDPLNTQREPFPSHHVDHALLHLDNPLAMLPTWHPYCSYTAVSPRTNCLTQRTLRWARLQGVARPGTMLHHTRLPPIQNRKHIIKIALFSVLQENVLPRKYAAKKSPSGRAQFAILTD